MKVTINGLSINYETFGSGEPAICIHGWNENCSIFKSRAYKSLLKDYKVYAIDLPGFGKSERQKMCCFEALTELLDEFSKYIQAESFNLFGQCMGGIIALDYSIRYKEKVRKLILIETMIYFPLSLNLLLIKHLNSWVLKFMLKKKMGIGLLNFHKALRSSSKNKKFFEMLKKVDVTQSLEYIRLMKEYSRYDHINRAKDLETPVIIIMSTNTFLQVNKTASDLADALKCVQVLEFPNKNHFLYAE